MECLVEDEGVGGGAYLAVAGVVLGVVDAVDAQVGSVLVISVDGNDIVVEEDASIDPATAVRRGKDVDWIVVTMHQFTKSSSASSHGGDIGIREQLLPLFDRYSVHLVLAGHDHDDERTHPVRGTDPGTLLRPAVVDDDLREIDASKGTVHMILGGGGTASNDDIYLGSSDSSGIPDAFVRTQRLTFEANPDATEKATWSAVRDPNTAYPYGIAVFDVDPGTRPGDRTGITVSCFHIPTATAAVPFPAPALFDRFTLYRSRSRSDGHGSAHHGLLVGADAKA